MAWLCVNPNGDEFIAIEYPWRQDSYPDHTYAKWECYEEWSDEWEDHTIKMISKLPQGSIEKLIGGKLTWEDEPVEI